MDALLNFMKSNKMVFKRSYVRAFGKGSYIIDVQLVEQGSNNLDLIFFLKLTTPSNLGHNMRHTQASHPPFYDVVIRDHNCYMNS